jgi:N,N'-diacetyllegionaminate synthase
MFGHDVKASLTMEETTALEKIVKNIETALQKPLDKSVNSKFDSLKSIFEKSLAVNKNLKKGNILTFSDLETKKPKGFGILANDYESIIGQKINRDLKQWDFLNDKNLFNIMKLNGSIINTARGGVANKTGL